MGDWGIHFMEHGKIELKSMCILYVLSHSIDMYAACINSAISLTIELQS